MYFKALFLAAFAACLTLAAPNAAAKRQDANKEDTLHDCGAAKALFCCSDFDPPTEETDGVFHSCERLPRPQLHDRHRKLTSDRHECSQPRFSAGLQRRRRSRLL